MTDPIQAWVDESDDNRRLFNQEGLIIDVSEAIWEILEDQNISKAELAERLGTSRANITKLLDGSRNMTLRTLADIATALGYKVRVNFTEAAQDTVRWENIGQQARPTRKAYSIALTANIDACNGDRWQPLRVA